MIFRKVNGSLMEWIGRFRWNRLQFPVACNSSCVCRRRSGKFYPLHLSHDANQSWLLLAGRRTAAKEEVFTFDLLCPGHVEIVYSALAVFAALTGQLFGALLASPWAYLIVGNVCLFFGLVMLEAVPLAPPGFLNNLKVAAFSGHDVFTSMILGGASALVVSTCTTPILGVLLAMVAAKRQIALGCTYGFLIFNRLGGAGNSSRHFHRIAYIAAAIRQMDASDTEDLRHPDDSCGGILPDKDWRVFAMNLVRSGTRRRRLYFFLFFLLTVPVRGPVLCGRRG